VIRVDHRFAAMGGAARVTLESDTVSEAELERHAAAIRPIVEDVEAALSRFRPESELSALNRDPRPAMPASPLLRHFAVAVRSAGARSGGLVDATLLAPLERQRYTTSRAGVAPAVLDEALAAAPPRRPARPHPARAHAGVGVDERARIVRPPGVRLDSGGLGSRSRCPTGRRGPASGSSPGTWPPSCR
jgi:thiamine biosynthesis lipoprotein